MEMIITALKRWWASNKVEFVLWKKQFMVLFFIYIIGISSILRANYNYLDDIGRVVAGFLGWDDFSRYLNVILATIIHGDTLLNDISPLPQILAVAITAASSVVLMKVFTNSCSWWSVLALIPLGLSPYFLECLSFKFDSPYMALSVFASVFPLLFMDEDERLYLFVVAVGALVMFTTYQASSGIFIVCLSFLLALRWSQGEDLKKSVNCFFKSSLVFVIIAVLFKVLLVKEYNDYVSTDIVGSKNLLYVVFDNTTRYLRLLWQDSTIAWRIMFAGIVLCFVKNFTLQSARNRIHTFFVAIILVMVCGILSYGGYLVLQKPLFYPRAMYGFGVYVAILGIIAVSSWKEKMLSKVVCLFMSWSLFVFALAYGNALAEQKRYDNFRIQMIVNDLSKVPNLDNAHVRKMQLKGKAGYSPVITRMSERYKVLKRLIHVSIEAEYCLGEYYLFNYFTLPGVKQEPNWEENKTIIEDDNIPVFVDTAYHTIKADEENIVVILKDTSIKLL